MKTTLLSICLFITATAFSQKKVYFNNKKINDLKVNIGIPYGMEEFKPTFPNVWIDFDANSEYYIFSGYYSIDPKSTGEEPILNGEIKLNRYQFQVGEGTENIKEELTFNMKNGNMSGAVTYNEYFSDYNGETNESDLKNTKWTKTISLSAFFNEMTGNYQNIIYAEFRDYVREKCTVTQANSYDISLNYFNTVIKINEASIKDKPVFKKVKY